MAGGTVVLSFAQTHFCGLFQLKPPGSFSITLAAFPTGPLLGNRSNRSKVPFLLNILAQFGSLAGLRGPNARQNEIRCLSPAKIKFKFQNLSSAFYRFPLPIPKCFIFNPDPEVP